MVSARLGQIRNQMQHAHDVRPGGLKGHQQASMVQVGQVLWLLDEVERLNRHIVRYQRELIRLRAARAADALDDT